MQDLSLFMYRDGQHVTDFVAYLVARGVGKGTTAKIVTTSKKVLDHLDAISQYAHTGKLLMYLTR